MKTKFGLLLSITLTTSLHAQVSPNDAVVGGKTIGEWSAAWWEWIFLISTNMNPMLDTSGAFAAVGQPSGDVFLVAGDFGLTPNTFTRTFSVPEGKYLFFPVLMYEADNFATCPPCLSVAELREQAAGTVTNIAGLHASIDGVEIPDLVQHRAISPAFNTLLATPDNVFTLNYQVVATGLVDPQVSDGYWLMVGPLPLGPHVLRIDGDFSIPFFFGNHVVDYITIVPVSLSQRVEELTSLVDASNLAEDRHQSLLGSLDAAKASFVSTHFLAGINQLHAFQNKVRAQVAPGDQALADRLTQAAQKIIEKAESQLP